jgi:serine/threonine protein kinase
MAGTLKVDPPGGGDTSTDASDDPSARLGTIIAGRYAVRRLLGAGGMGAVYEAENTVTGRRVALKVMLPRAASVDTAPERFLREARAASKVEHPHIVDVLDAGQNPADGCWYIVQELLEGRELRAEMEARGRLPWPAVMTLLGPVMEALGAAHRQGIVHRDVKPENIFLAHSTGGTVPKLIDFGIARLLDGDGPLNLTRSGALLGTPNYMAPEQARGLKDIDARADVWAMGVVLREALCGERPFKNDNYNAMMVSILSDPIPPIADVCAGLPAHVSAALDRALARDRDRRFRDVGELLEALRRGSTDVFANTAPGVVVPRVRSSRPVRAVGFVAGGALIAAVAFTLGTRSPARPTVSPERLIAPTAVLRAEPTPAAAPTPPPPPPVETQAPVAQSGVAAPGPVAATAPPRPRGTRRVLRRAPALTPPQVTAQPTTQSPTQEPGIIRTLHGS